MNVRDTLYASGTGTVIVVDDTLLVSPSVINVGTVTSVRLTVPKNSTDIPLMYAYGKENWPGTDIVYNFGGGVLENDVLYDLFWKVKSHSNS